MNKQILAKMMTVTFAVASLATSGVAGYKALASKGESEMEVPILPSPTPAPTTSPSTAPTTGSTTTQTLDESIVPEASTLPDASIAPLPTATDGSFPVASMDPSKMSGDDDDFDDESEDEIEIEHHDREDDHEEED